MRRFRLRRSRRLWPSWLERLLGPDEPQLSCEECFAELDHYVELETSGVDAAAEVPRMTAHLEGCPACKEEHDELLEFVRLQRS
ncbi:MAG TPA: hypothetical protein VH416_03760 [Gaiellaceae bacterium]|jgi:hypothetical protein